MPVLAATRPTTWRMTVSQYDHLAELGWFSGRRVELIDGRVLRMAAQLEPHVAGVSLARKAVASAFGDGYYVRVQAPLVQGRFSKPEPDIAVVRGNERDYVTAGTPTSALLIIEISDTTLRQDRGRKASIYARFGIDDYWIVNLADRQLEVHRDPVLDRKYPRRFCYANVKVLQPADHISPLAAPQASIQVAELLP